MVLTTSVSTVVRLFRHISPQRRRQFGWLLLLTVIGSVAEVISVAAVVPFIAVLTQPDRLLDVPLGAWAMQVWKASDPSVLLGPLAAVFAAAAVAAGVVRLLLVWAGIHLGNATGADLSIDVYRRTLYQPYRVHVARHSGEIISSITQKVGTATAVLISLVTVFTSAALFVSILVTLVVIDPGVALSAAGVFGVAYCIVAWLSRTRLSTNSHEIAKQQTTVVTSLQEGLGAIRDVLLQGSQPVYVGAHAQAVRRLMKATSDNAFINQAPRFVMETVALVMVAGLALFVTRRGGAVAGILPVLGALGLGAQRLLPLLQQLYGHWATVVGSQGALVDTLALLEQPLPADADAPPPDQWPLRHAIQMEHIRFRYDPGGPWVLDDVSLTIPRGCRLGIAGTTGSGKSTLLDLVVGLLDPTSGVVLVDGEPLGPGNRRAWQQAIAHVPQHIYLADASVAENIAFGVPSEAVDMVRVREAARRARIDDFIATCSDGYGTRVGERGVRLSGGQRQRIGIARALYRRAVVLVFDEATSALDSGTEEAVMSSIEGLDRSLTVLIVAHRQSTLKYCDDVVYLANGRLVDPVAVEVRPA